MHRAGYCSLALLILEGGASAQPSRAGRIAEPERAARRYSAPLECPDAEAFWAEVNERAPRATSGDVQITVRIQRQAEHYQADMQWQGATGGTHRSVVGERCEETSAAIALVVALALVAQVEKAAPSSAPEPANPEGMHLSVQAEGVVDGAPAPQWVFGAGAGLRAATHDRSAELGVVMGYRGATAEAQGQSFEVAVLSLRVDACPLTLALTERWAVVPCAFVDVGGFRAEARAGFSNSAGPVFASWGGIGGSAQLRVRLGERFSAALGPGLQAPFQRGYQLATGDPDTQGSIPLYVVPTWSAFGALSARYELN